MAKVLMENLLDEGAPIVGIVALAVVFWALPPIPKENDMVTVSDQIEYAGFFFAKSKTIRFLN